VRREVAFCKSRCSRIQLEGAPGDVDVVAMAEAFERDIEPTFTDRTPRTYDVRKYLDIHMG
jgi:hypothetical protein